MSDDNEGISIKPAVAEVAVVSVTVGVAVATGVADALAAPVIVAVSVMGLVLVPVTSAVSRHNCVAVDHGGNVRDCAPCRHCRRSCCRVRRARRRGDASRL
ncbi:MAG: hypothetical protein R2867_19110 [Caldilineaceae bacterium]